MRERGWLLGLLLALCSGAAPAVAQPGPAPVPEGRMWQAVGRLEIGDGLLCTVTLVAADRALTAAHCVVDPQTGRPFPPEAFTLRLGFVDGRAPVTRGVRSFALAGAWAASEAAPNLSQVVRDVVLLALDRPVRAAEIAPVSMAATAGAVPHRLTVVSYARGRTQVAAVQEDCQLILTREDGALVLDCDIDRGASGSPVIDRTGAVPQIVGVISARGRMSREGMPTADVALAAPIPGPAMAAAPGAGAAARTVAAQGPAGGVRVRRGIEGAEAAPGGARVLRLGAP